MEPMEINKGDCQHGPFINTYGHLLMLDLLGENHHKIGLTMLESLVSNGDIVYLLLNTSYTILLSKYILD